MRILPSPVVISSSGPPPFSLPRMRECSIEPLTVTGMSSWIWPSPGVGVELRRKVFRQPRFNPTVAGVNQPAAVQLGAGTNGEVDVAVAGAQVEIGKDAIDGHVPVAGMAV